jgi:hypothetical protein
MRRTLALAFVCLLTGLHAHAAQKSAEQILQSYVEDYRSDANASGPETFAIRVSGDSGGDWFVTIGNRDSNGRAEVILHRGLPTGSFWFYKLDMATLEKVDRGELNVLTAMGKAKESDTAPMDIDATPDFQPPAEWEGRLLPLTFHFWTRGWPETVPFGKEFSRVIHGANVVGLYYQKGLRTVWARVEKGQHVDEGGKADPFPTLVMVIRGTVMSRIGKVERKLQAGEMVFIPANTTDEDWNPFDEPAEVILVMFGDQA